MTDPYRHDDWTDEQRLAALAWAEFMDRAFNVHHYGATGDGSDQTAAFAAATLAAHEAGGGCVFIPAGDYRVDWSKMPSHARGIRYQGVGSRWPEGKTVFHFDAPGAVGEQ